MTSIQRVQPAGESGLVEPSPESHGPAAGFALCTSHKTSGIPGQCLRSQPEVRRTPSPSRAFWQSCPPSIQGSYAPAAGRAGGCGSAPCSQLQEGDCQVSFQNPQNHFAPYYLLLLGLSPTCPHFKISLTPSRAGYSLSICSPSSVWAPDCEQMAPTGCLRTGEGSGLSPEPPSWQSPHEARRLYHPICLFGCTSIKDHVQLKT